MIFDSITKYTIVENPHPPQGGVPLFFFDVHFENSPKLPRNSQAKDHHFHRLPKGDWAPKRTWFSRNAFTWWVGPSSRRLENTAWLAHWYWPGWIPWWHFPMFSKTWNAFWKFHPLCNSHKPEMLACFQRAPSNIDGTVRFSRPNMAGAISSRLKYERWGIPVGSPRVSRLITQ